MDLTVVGAPSGSVECPPGYVMNGQDLNEGAGGDFIYACQKLSNEPADKNRAITRIGVVGAWESDEVRNFCTRPNEKRIRYGGYVPYDLNKGAGGAYVYFCSPGPPHDLQVSRIKAIAFDVYSWPGPTELWPPCENRNWDPNYHSGREGWQLAPVHYAGAGRFSRGDLNAGAGGKFIYTCEYRVDG